MSRARGCLVIDNGRPCRMGLYIEEHELLPGIGWVHPDEIEDNE